jgi:hypothetical protein
LISRRATSQKWHEGAAGLALLEEAETTERQEPEPIIHQNKKESRN